MYLSATYSSKNDVCSVATPGKLKMCLITAGFKPILPLVRLKGRRFDSRRDQEYF